MPVLPALAGSVTAVLLQPGSSSRAQPSSHRNALNFPSRLPAPGDSVAVRNPEEKALQNTQITGGLSAFPLK